MLLLAGGFALTAVPVAGSAAPGTFELRAVYSGQIAPTTCPAGTPATTGCYRNSGGGAVPGLGRVSEDWTLVVDRLDTLCPRMAAGIVLTIAAKGSIQLQAASSGCAPDPPLAVDVFALAFTVAGGSGSYAAATGAGTLEVRFSGGADPGSVQHHWSGTLDVPGVVFDLSAPVIRGAAAKTVRAPKRAKSVRVRYSVSAQDEVDGRVRVACRPASGSRFRIGRTTVTCTAEDSSANATTTRFRVTVKRGRR